MVICLYLRLPMTRKKYPDEICCTEMCHNRVLFNVLGPQKFKSVFNDNKFLSKAYVDETDLQAMFKKGNDNQHCAIHCISDIHWVAMADECFYDDSNQCAILDFTKCKYSTDKIVTKR